MRIEIVTIFPGFFAGILENGIVRRAQADCLLTVGIHDLRTFTHDRHRTVDDRPFGGGEGMVLKPEPLAEVLASLDVVPKAERQTAQPEKAPLADTRVILDATMRLVPGVLGNQASGEFESFGVADAEIASDVQGVPRSQHGAGGLLDYPHFTRPAEFAGLRAPEVLIDRKRSC